MDYLTFPAKGLDLVDAIQEAANQGCRERNLASIRWQYTHWHLQGCRNMRVANWHAGQVVVPYENVRGELQFNYHGASTQYQTQLGRLLPLDVTPVTKGVGFGLDAVRRAGTGHATLNYMQQGLRQQDLKMRVLQCLLKFGTVGMWHYRGEGDDISSRTRVDVVPPWELLPIPAEVNHMDDLRGLIRERAVPLNWVLELEGVGKPSEDDLEVEVLSYGESPTGPQGFYRGQHSRSMATRSWKHKRLEAERSRASGSSFQGRGGGAVEGQKWVKLREVLLFTDNGLLARYLLNVGKVVVIDHQYAKEGIKVVPPCGVARFLPVGGFYGQGYVDRLISLNTEIEKMLRVQFQDVQDIDTYRSLVVSDMSGITDAQLKRPQRRKVLRAAADPNAPNFQPYYLEPPHSGDFAGKMVQLGIGIQDKQGGQGSMFDGGAPGRVESAAGLGFMHEVMNVSLAAATHEVANAYQAIYRSLLQAAKAESEEGNAAFPLPILDDRMVGVSVKYEKGQLIASGSPIPAPWEVDIDIRDRAGHNKEKKKQEALMMLQSQLLTPLDFRILNMREDWGFPVGDRTDWEAWRKATYSIIVLFNDGKTPGQPLGGETYDRSDIFIGVLTQFMNSVEFSLASLEVQEAFIQAKIQYETSAGKYPDQLPYPEIAAQMAQQQMQQMQQAQAGPPGGGNGQGVPAGMPAPAR